ncbi:hypothetical protein MBANPS3_003626 [Mucor bainieri]
MPSPHSEKSQPSSSRHEPPTAATTTTTQQQQSQAESQKLIEAKTAVILLKNSRLCTKNEYTQWLLKKLYQPCSRRDTEVSLCHGSNSSSSSSGD